MTLAEFVDVIRACAGEPDEYDLNGDILDVSFDDLGYDSLALIEVSARLKQDHGIVVDEIPELASPRIALELINGTREREVA
jgi:act minimal PKS acyl carrier protein